MVSEHYESVDRELHMTYSAFDYMADDRIQQKDESRKKEAINLQSAVADFKQQLQDQLTMFNRNVIEMIREELSIIRSQSGPYIENPTKSSGSSLLESASGGTTSNDDEAVHTPDLSHCNLNVTALIGSEEGIHDQVFDCTNETKSFPDLNTVTVKIEEGGVEEKRETEGPTKDKRRSIGDGGSSYYLFNCGGNKSTRSSSLDGPESKKLDSSPNPDPEPPDVYCPTPNVSFPVESSTIPSLAKIGEEGGILKGNREPIGREGITNRISDIEEFEPLKDNHSTNRPEYGDLGLRPGPDPEPPDVDSSSFLAGSSKESITVASSNEKDAGIWTVQVQPNRHKAHVRAQNSLSPIVSHTQMNQLSPAVKIVRSISKERSQVTGIQVITNLEHVRTLNFRTTSSPCYYKTNDAINQSLTSTDFRIRPNMDPKLPSNSNSEPHLKLPSQLFRPFYTTTVLFPCPIPSKRAGVCVESDRRAEHGKLESEIAAVKTLQYEKEVITMKNREGIGVGHESKIKKTKYSLVLKEEERDTVWFWSWTDQAKAKQGIGLLHQFQAVRVDMWNKHICIQGNLDELESWQNCESGTLAEKPWTPTLVLEGKGDRKPTCKESTSMAIGRGDTVTGLLPFLYFFYPP